jgi:hypothetical protein
MSERRNPSLTPITGVTRRDAFILLAFMSANTPREDQQRIFVGSYSDWTKIKSSVTQAVLSNAEPRLKDANKRDAILAHLQHVGLLFELGSLGGDSRVYALVVSRSNIRDGTA